MRLRYDGRCHVCEVALPAQTEAWWDRAEKRVTCLSCEAAPVPEPAAAPAVAAGPPLPLTDEERGVAGASARAERVRRSARREARVRAKHPRLGGLMLAVSDDPSSTKVWDQGAIGEERIGRRLDEARSQGIEVLHDRRVPRSRANIDHIVIAPSGIWIVDPKRYLKGRLERRDVGGLFRTDHRLYVGGRDQTKLVEAMHGQVELVQASLSGTSFEETPVRGALCFVGTELGLFAKPFELRGVAITWGKHLVAPMLTPEVVAPPTRTALARHLADWFRPA